MDDLMIDLPALVVEGPGPVDEAAVSAAIRAHANELLPQMLLVQVCRAVVESIEAIPLGPGNADMSTRRYLSPGEQ